LVAAVVVGVVIHKNSDKNSKDTSTSQSIPERGVNSVSYAPSTAKDNSSNETRKSNPSDAAQTLDNGPTTSATSSSSAASMTITNAHESDTNQISASADVSGATSGTCTFTASMSGQPNATATAPVQLSSNGDYYDCGPATINVATTGKWAVSGTVESNGTNSAKVNWAANPVTVE
jgi:hypothetical protein